MARPFDLIEEFADVVQIEAGLDPAKIASLDRESRPGRRRRRSRQAAPERLVDDVLEGATGPPGLGLQLGRHVCVEAQCGTHIVMLNDRHHDVNAPATSAAPRAS